MKNIMNTVSRAFMLIILLAFFSLAAVSQESTTVNQINTEDSLSLETILKDVLASHPSVIKSTEAIQMAESGIGLAKSARLPDVDFGAGYMRMGPIPSIDIPGMGTFKMAPADNYNATLNVRETIYDFSKTEKNIQLQQNSKEIATANLELVKQRLALLTAVNYYTLAYYQEALRIKDLQISTLKEHLDFVKKKLETGSATKYEVLSTEVRLSSAESQKVDLETARQNSLTTLNSLLGLPSGTILKVKPVEEVPAQPGLPDKMVEFAVSHRTEMALAELKQHHAELNLSSIKVQNNPVLSAFTSGGFKNGYIPELNKIRANYTAGLSLKVPIFTATRQKYNLLLATSEINLAKQDQQLTRRDISAEVYQNDANLQASLRKIEQSELQVKQAEEARSLAEVSYKAGVVTNLDLLDTETLEAESRLNLLRARSEYMVNLFRLNQSTGSLPY